MPSQNQNEAVSISIVENLVRLSISSLQSEVSRISLNKWPLHGQAIIQQLCKSYVLHRDQYSSLKTPFLPLHPKMVFSPSCDRPIITPQATSFLRFAHIASELQLSFHLFIFFLFLAHFSPFSLASLHISTAR
jgi:hypothetical protein